MRGALLLLVTATALFGTQRAPVTASDCPLDLSWSDFTSAVSACSNPNIRGNCCRYINAFVAISVARYAHAAGKLGVPPAFSEMCITSVSENLKLHGIPPEAILFCGLGTKILVTYQCKGRTTALEMLQSPYFIDVKKSCDAPLNVDVNCKKCMNSAILYLHNLIGADDNVTLSTCRDAVFIALANEVDQVSAIDMASCFFGVQGLGNLPVNTSAAPSSLQTPNTSPGPVLVEPPPPNLLVISVKQHHFHYYRITLIQGIGIGIIGLAAILLIIFILLIRSKSKELKFVADSSAASWKAIPLPAQNIQEDHTETKFMGPLPMFKRFSHKEMKRATNNFSSIIGKGGFGVVYKAHFCDGSVAAVKRMNKVSEQGEDDFGREMELIGRLHHRHLVTLKGFCVQKRERYLVYEYMENGNLTDHLHSPGRSPISWDTRVRIAIDVANALEYLHFYCDPPLCHSDIKSSNILLDENFVAKVADFGLARTSTDGSISFKPVAIGICGTPGYMDPEFMITQELTGKSDIYSYGVLLLEIVSARHAIEDNKNIVEWSQQFTVTDSKLVEMVDPLIVDSFDLEQVHVIVGIAHWCTQREGKQRPSIKQVLRILHERLDPLHTDFEEAMRDGAEDGYGASRMNKGKCHQSEAFPQNGDGKCLMSSSSTSRSYCSRSLLLESGSPRSPPTNFPV